MDPDLRRAAEAFERALAEAGLADRAALFQLAAASPIDPPAMVVLLDVPLRYRAEQRLVEALARTGADILATLPEGDERSQRRFSEALATPVESIPVTGSTALARMQRGLFAPAVEDSLPPSEDVPTVDVLSAPGEGREAVEIARRIHVEAGRGVPFERMAILLRAPGQYRSAIAEALARAEIPAYYSRGTRGPDPSGRALLSLLACADERLSARRFAEYLSLGEVPTPTPQGGPPPASSPSLAFRPAEADELAPLLVDPEEPEDRAASLEREDQELAQPARPLVIAPRKWEQLIIEAAVMGGRDRWRRRLERLAEQLERQAAAPDLDEARAERLQRDREQLQQLTRFALPLIDDLAQLPARATWREWLVHLRALVERALRYPDRVQRVLSELEPMGEIGPVALSEVRLVLSGRLTEMTRPGKRERDKGYVFVGSIEDARGMDLDVVFVPGMAERIFPMRLTEDPILLDAARAEISPELETSRERAAAERLQLRLASGAARQRIRFSYPRVDAEQARPRVPSFYGLEVLPRVRGRPPRLHRPGAQGGAGVPGPHRLAGAGGPGAGHRRRRARPVAPGPLLPQRGPAPGRLRPLPAGGERVPGPRAPPPRPTPPAPVDARGWPGEAGPGGAGGARPARLHPALLLPHRAPALRRLPVPLLPQGDAPPLPAQGAGADRAARSAPARRAGPRGAVPDALGPARPGPAPAHRRGPPARAAPPGRGAGPGGGGAPRGAGPLHRAHLAGRPGLHQGRRARVAAADAAHLRRVDALEVRAGVRPEGP